jgi:16S rRNA (adenine1518-N6/adenine1519-N6)-dimethyltransferase
MVQREVADRIAAAPSTPDRGQAGVWIQQAYDVAALRTVPPTCFWPRPEIASTVLPLVRHDRLPLSPQGRLVFERITKSAFLHRRKQMLGIFRNLSAETGLEGDEAIAAWLAAAELSPQVRPDAITNEEWRALALALPGKGGE